MSSSSTLDDGDHRGRGEASGVYYLGDDSAADRRRARSNRAAIEAGPDRAGRCSGCCRPGGARNAVDCALWDLEAQRTGARRGELAGIAAPRPLVTTFTLGADDPAIMAEGARNIRRRHGASR